MTSTPSARRRNLLEPMETTSRSSKRSHASSSDQSLTLSEASNSSNDSMEDTAKAKRALLSPNDDTSGVRQKREAEHVENVPVRDIEVDESRHRSLTNDSTCPGHPASRSDRDATPEVPATQVEPKAQTHKRRFAPDPVEVSSRSSKKDEPKSETPSSDRPRRRFAPEPVETNSRSSKDKKEEPATDNARPRRRFAPEPVETSTRSSKQGDDEEANNETKAKPKRRFAPQPVETSTRSSKDKEQESDSTEKKPRRKFLPQPVETTTVRRRNTSDGQFDFVQDGSPKSPSATPSRSSSGGRRFQPELIETAKASYRKEPVASAVPKYLRPASPPVEEEQPDETPEVPESRFSSANLLKRARSQNRRHSYCVPDLPIIESDSSGDEAAPSATKDSSALESRHRRLKVEAETQGLSYTDYVLRLASQVDERILREQIAAAYINDEEHVPVSHFAAEDDDSDSEPIGRLSGKYGVDTQTFRRMSHTDLSLVMEDMRKHHEQLERAKREYHEDTAGASRFSAAALATRHHRGIHHPNAAAPNTDTAAPGAARQEDAEYKKMWAAASPPMAGDDLQFPFTVTPKMTRCDPDQIPRPRRADSDSDREEEKQPETKSLWAANAAVKKDAAVGLWGGLCQRGDNTSNPVSPDRSGLQTPMWEAKNPFDSATPARGARTPGRKQVPPPWSGMAFMPLTPPHSTDGDQFTSAVDKKLQLEKTIDEEFPNRVITQIYNYLSLGYPPLARPFDEELSKISRIPIGELRRGDRSDSGNVKGYIGAPEGQGDGVEDNNGLVRGCKRWEALRLYVREWARQSPNFASERAMLAGGMGRLVGSDAWGANAPVRKGSWAH